MEILFRPASTADAARVAEVYLRSRKTFLPYAPLAHADDDVRAWIRGTLIPSGRVTVAVADGEILGLMVLSSDGAFGWVDQLYLDPSAVSRGIGARLLERAKAELGAPIRLHTFQENAGARRFYERHGFRALAFGDGSENEERCPDVLYEWRPGGFVTAVSRSAGHSIRKTNQASIRLVTGLGVEGDAHQGEKVKHRSRVARDPSQPNLRQVHLIHAELHDELRQAGFALLPGQMGENVTTRGLDLLGLPTGALLHLGETASVAVTGLRNPCAQLDGIRPGLMKAVLGRDAAGSLIRKAGIMGVVVRGGELRPGDPIRVELPSTPQRALEPV